MINAETQFERWHYYKEYNISVSDTGYVYRQGKALPLHLVKSDLRVTVLLNGKPRSFSVKRLIADAFVEKTFVGNTGIIELVNGNPRDCRADNLIWRRREQKNRGAAGEPGVSFNQETKRWKVYAVVNRVVCYIGYYDEKDMAVAARNRAYDMISEGIPIDEIRDKLREIVTERRPKAVPPPPVRKPKESWRDWDNVDSSAKANFPIVNKSTITNIPPRRTPPKNESWRDWDEVKEILANSRK